MTKHAYITPDTKSKDNKAFWLIVEKEKESADGVAYPLMEDEIEVIMQACQDFLKKK